MFSESVWDPWASPSRRGWTTMISFVVQTTGVVVLLVAPLIYTNGPSRPDLVPRIFVPLPPAGLPPQVLRQAVAVSTSNLSPRGIRVPSSIPTTIAIVDDHGIAPAIEVGVGIPYGTGTLSAHNPIVDSIGAITQPFVPKPPAAPVAHHPPRISALMTGYLVHKVEPVYPALARAARVQGTVELQAIISKQGTIEQLQVLHGHPLLVKPAVEAVRQWRYRPYLLNSEPVEVETHITVNFFLSGG